jgi:hypothetical protein
MVKFSVKDKGKVLANLLTRNKKFRRDVRKGFIFAADEFIARIRGKWYSGRRADDTGLNVRTGFLRRSWQPVIKEEALNILAVIRSGARYGLYHEEGTEKLPKRTFIKEDMKGRLGTKLFTQAVKEALKAF